MYDPGYSFDDPGFDKGTGHFTQLMWNSTTQVGMGHSVGGDGKVYITARLVYFIIICKCRVCKFVKLFTNLYFISYTPPGNDAREGMYTLNVPPPLNSQSICALSYFLIHLLFI